MKKITVIALSLVLFSFSCGDDGEDENGEKQIEELPSEPSIVELEVNCETDFDGVRFLKIRLVAEDKEGDYEKISFTWPVAETPEPAPFELTVPKQEGGKAEIKFDDFKLDFGAANGNAAIEAILTDAEGNSSQPFRTTLCICISGPTC